MSNVAPFPQTRTPLGMNAASSVSARGSRHLSFVNCRVNSFRASSLCSIHQVIVSAPTVP